MGPPDDVHPLSGDGQSDACGAAPGCALASIAQLPPADLSGLLSSAPEHQIDFIDYLTLAVDAVTD